MIRGWEGEVAGVLCVLAQNHGYVCAEYSWLSLCMLE